jgi:single-strand DNA-binding protein
MSKNVTLLVGHVGSVGELRKTTKGTPIINFSMATNERWKDRETGEARETTEWHRCVAMGGLAETVDQYLEKGRLVSVEGQKRTRRWEAECECGKKHDRFQSDIWIRPGGFSFEGKANGSGRADRQEGDPMNAENSGPVEIPDDDIPF